MFKACRPKNIIITVVSSVIFAWISCESFRTVKQSQERVYRHEAFAVWRVAKLSAIQEGLPSGETREIVSQSTGYVTEEGVRIKDSFTMSGYIWKGLPSDGVRIPLLWESDKDMIFYACSERADVNGKRSFVFPAPWHHQILRDSEIDWETQRIKKKNDE